MPFRTTQPRPWQCSGDENQMSYDDIFSVLVLAIELLAACQAVEFLRPLKTTEPLEEVYKCIREVAK